MEIKLRERRRRELPNDQREEIKSIFLDVKNIEEVKRQTHHSRATIFKYLKEAGINVKQYGWYNNFRRIYPRDNKPEGFRGHSSPLEYFLANRERYNGLRRTELARCDNSLYNSLLKAHQMDEAIPESQMKRKPRIFKGNPFAYFKEHEEKYRGMTRTELRDFDQVLYKALAEAHQMDEAIPKETGFRGHQTALEYYHTNRKKYEGIQRKGLMKFDNVLYRALLKANQLDEAIPKMYRGYKSPLDYFLANRERYQGMNRTKLSLADKGLYRSLVRHGQLDEAIPL